jgi:hypothetical protein
MYTLYCYRIDFLSVSRIYAHSEPHFLEGFAGLQLTYCARNQTSVFNLLHLLSAQDSCIAVHPSRLYATYIYHVDPQVIIGRQGSQGCHQSN